MIKGTCILSLNISRVSEEENKEGAYCISRMKANWHMEHRQVRTRINNRIVAYLHMGQARYFL